MGGSRLFLSVALFLLLFSVPTTRADWYQDGHDAARTGHVPFELPQNDDVALLVELPSERQAEPARADPIVVGRSVFVAMSHRVPNPNGVLRSYSYVGTVFQIDLDEPTPRPILNVSGRVIQMATDGRELFVVAEYSELWGVLIEEPLTKWRLWLGNVPETEANARYETSMGCAPLAVRDDHLFLPCRTACCTATMGTVMKISIPDRRVNWTWRMDTSTEHHRPRSLNALDVANFGLTGLFGLPFNGYVYIAGFTLLGGVGVLTAWSSDAGLISIESWGIGLSEGATRWYRGHGPVGIAGDDALTRSESRLQIPAPVTGNDTQMFRKFRLLERLDVENPSYYASEWQDVRQGDLREPDVGSGLAFDGERVFATSLRFIHRLSNDLGVEQSWRLPPDLAWGKGGLVVGGGCVLARAFRGLPDEYGSESPGAANVLYCLDPESLEPVWSKEFFGHIEFAATDGLVVIQDGPRALVVGHTDASLKVRYKVTTQYPAPGAVVAIDLAQSVPGRFGAPTEFAVDWGDGTPLQWQSAAVLTHTYPLAAEFHARVFVANEAGQTASERLTFHVGQDDPKASYVELAFSPKYQERTFFLLGAVLTLAVALAGVIRFRVRHARFQRELAEVDGAYTRHRGDPDVCVAVLEERRHHVRGLLVRRRLDESHVGTLERRIDELHRTVRMQLVDERFEFLPVGLVKRIRAVLEDGLVTRLEQSQIHDVLERDPTLLPEHKRRVRKLLATWSTQDEVRATARVAARSR